MFDAAGSFVPGVAVERVGQANASLADACACVGVETPKEIVTMGEEHSSVAGYQGLTFDRFGSFVVDETALYYGLSYDFVYLRSLAAGTPNQVGRYNLERVMKHTLASGETRVLAEINGGVQLVGGRLYWNEEAPRPYSDIVQAREASSELRSMSTDGGKSVSPPHGLNFAASATHLFWRDRSTIVRQELAGGAPTVVLRDVGPGRLIEALGVVYWLEPVPRAKGVDASLVRDAHSSDGFRIVRLGVDDDAGSEPRWLSVSSRAAAHIGSGHLDSDIIAWPEGNCTMFFRLDGSEERCGEVKLSARYVQIVLNDVAYSRSDLAVAGREQRPIAIVRTPLTGVGAGKENTIVRCNDLIPQLRISSDKIWFECRRSIWSVSRLATGAESLDAASDSASAGR